MKKSKFTSREHVRGPYHHLSDGIGPFDSNVSLSPYLRPQKTKVFCFVPFHVTTRVYLRHEAIRLLRRTKTPHTLEQRTRGYCEMHYRGK